MFGIIPLHVHGVMLFPFFFLVAIFTCHAAAAQPPLPSPPPPPKVDFNPMVAMLITLTVSALFFIIFFSIYIIDCTSPPPDPLALVGRSRHGVPPPKGLDPGVVAGFPTFVYSEVKEHKIGKGALECAVCICEFEDYETLRLIPKCNHVFHPECIDEWLSGHVTCPVCRANLVPQSGDSVKGGTDDPGQEGLDSVEIVVDEPGSVSEEATRVGNAEAGAEQTEAVDNARESGSGKPGRRRLGRSHSTGHSLFPRGEEDMERFTLRLPEEVRNQIMERPTTPYFPSEGSTRRGVRSGGDGSSRGRFLRRLDRLDRMERPAKSERWIFSRMPSFLTRVSSMVPPKYANDGCGGEKSTSGRDLTVKPSEPAAGLNIV